MTNIRRSTLRSSQLGRLARLCVALPLLSLPAACIVGTDGTEGEAEELVEETAEDLTASQTFQLITGWAPILYQNVTQAEGTGSWGRGDFMTSFDYDGDFNGQNNWDNMDAHRLDAKMYAAITESTTHYFIYYTIYHPRSWINSSFYDEHENDAESAVFLVRKDGTQYGKLEAVITAFHSEGKVYRGSADVGDNPNNCAGRAGWRGCSTTHALITTENYDTRPHPQLFMEAEGHGLAACPASANCGISNANMIRYVPSLQGGGQPLLPVQGTQTVGYQIIDLGDLYKRRFDRPTFQNASNMAGDESGSCGDGPTVVCGENKTNAIWSYGVSGTPECQNHGLGEDPASVFRAIFSFNGLTPPSSDYLFNRFQHPKCDTTGRKLPGSQDPCVQQICAVDPFCCNNSWDALCQSRVASTCGLSCSNCNALHLRRTIGPDRKRLRRSVFQQDLRGRSVLLHYPLGRALRPKGGIHLRAELQRSRGRLRVAVRPGRKPPPCSNLGRAARFCAPEGRELSGKRRADSGSVRAAAARIEQTSLLMERASRARAPCSSVVARNYSAFGRFYTRARFLLSLQET